MSDINLFRIDGQTIARLESSSVELERTLQSLIEKHLETLLGVRFLETEYQTSGTHAGRIDTLGIDAENNCPVIIEYKRAVNENVINQGLFYLDWLMDHKADFELLCRNRLGSSVPSEIDWTAPRVLCIAADFTRYDEHAVQQIGRNIELIRYRRFGDDLLLLELVNAATSLIGPTGIPKHGVQTSTITDYLKSASSDLRDLYEDLRGYLLSLGDDVQMRTLKNYFAFRRLRNFACVEIHPRSKRLLVYVKLDPDSIELKSGFTRDVRSIGHFGTGDLEITIGSRQEFEKAKPLLLKSYDST